MITLEPEAVRPDLRITTDIGPGKPASRVSRLLRGQPDDPAWARPALLTLLVSTALLYLWGLGASGWHTTGFGDQRWGKRST